MRGDIPEAAMRLKEVSKRVVKYDKWEEEKILGRQSRERDPYAVNAIVPIERVRK
jgi:hypothetical protein